MPALFEIENGLLYITFIQKENAISISSCFIFNSIVCWPGTSKGLGAAHSVWNTIQGRKRNFILV